MPAAFASRARSPIIAIGQRDTPGSEAIGSSTSPDAMNKGQIKSAGVRTFSANIARLQA
jgi:hypothetical protein